jgi:hypothetical protein
MPLTVNGEFPVLVITSVLVAGEPIFTAPKARFPLSEGIRVGVAKLSILTDG